MKVKIDHNKRYPFYHIYYMEEDPGGLIEIDIQFHKKYCKVISEYKDMQREIKEMSDKDDIDHRKECPRCSGTKKIVVPNHLGLTNCTKCFGSGINPKYRGDKLNG